MIKLCGGQSVSLLRTFCLIIDNYGIFRIFMCILTYFYMTTYCGKFWSMVLTGIYHELQCPQVNLVNWLKMMVGNRRSKEVVDPNIEVRPSTRALKRALLTALRFVDPDSVKRPKMGQVMSMLESEEYPFPREVCFCLLWLELLLSWI